MGADRRRHGGLPHLLGVLRIQHFLDGFIVFAHQPGGNGGHRVKVGQIRDRLRSRRNQDAFAGANPCGELLPQLAGGGIFHSVARGGGIGRRCRGDGVVLVVCGCLVILLGFSLPPAHQKILVAVGEGLLRTGGFGLSGGRRGLRRAKQKLAAILGKAVCAAAQQHGNTHRQHQHRGQAAPALPVQDDHILLLRRRGGFCIGFVHSGKQRLGRKRGRQLGLPGLFQFGPQPFPVRLKFVYAVPVHFSASFPFSCNCRRSFFSVRESLLLTVPCGSPSMAAISRRV